VPDTVKGNREPFDARATSEGWVVRVLTDALERVSAHTAPRRRVVRHFGKPTSLERALEGLADGSYRVQLVNPEGLVAHSVTVVRRP
jgi:hypothetical protein